MDNKDAFLSIIIPCYNSASTIPIVVENVAKELKKLDIPKYEIILVNDCSPDNVFNVIELLCHNDNRIKALSLAKNSGQHAAILAGIRNSIGDALVFMDDDGEADIHDLNSVLHALGDECDLALGKYLNKNRSVFKKMGSRVNTLMAAWLMGSPMDYSPAPLIACKRYVADEIANYHGRNPYLLGLYLRTTSQIKYVPVNHKNRIAGRTNYTFRKMLSLWLNGFTAFSVKPLRIATVVGWITATISFTCGTYVIVSKIIEPQTAIDYSSTISVMLLFVGGVIMLMLGLICEYAGRIYLNMNNVPQYVIRKYVGFEDKDDEYKACSTNALTQMKEI